MQLIGNLSSSGPAGITLVGNNFVRSGSLITTNGGNFTVTNSGTITGTSINTTSIDGSCTQNGTGPVFFAGIISTNNHDISFTSPITLLAGGGFNTGSGAGDIILAGTVDGASSLNFTAGTGNVVLNSALGSITPLSDITITSASNVTAQAITAASISQLSGSGTSTFNGPITTSGATGINLTATNITRGGAWIANGSGGITVANTGTFTSTAPGTIQSVGSFNQSGSGPVIFAGSVLTNNTTIGFNGPITLAADTTLNSGPGAGNINISGSVDGAQNLTLNGGAGSIMTSAPMGANTPLNNLTITQTASASFAAVNAATITQIAGSGTTTLAGTVNTSALGGIALTGNNFEFTGAVTTSDSGPITITNAGVFTLSAPCHSSGAFNQIGAGTSSLESALSSSGSIIFAGAVNTVGSASLTTASSPITLQNLLNGPGDITFDAGTGSISLMGEAGGSIRLGTVVFAQGTNITTLGISAESITQTSGFGTTTITGDLNTSEVAGIDLSGTNFTITGSLISTSNGPCTIDHTGILTLNAGPSTLITGPFIESGIGGTVNLAGLIFANDANITFTNPITLIGTTTLNSDGAGDILISSTIDGLYDLIYIAGTGNITVNADIGDTTPVSSVTIRSANNVTTEAISSGIISQNAGTGTSTFNGAFTTTLPDGISLTGSAFVFNAPVTTQGSGPFTINNSGTGSFTSLAPIFTAGNFIQDGAGAVSLATTIQTQGKEISFAGPVTLTGTSSIDMLGLLGSITFGNTVDGANTLSLDGGTGAIVMTGVAGGITPLTTLQVIECNSFTSNAINAVSLDIEGIANLAALNGALNTSGAAGIVLKGASFAFNENVTTTGGGGLSITNTSTLTILPTLSLSLSGPFTQTGHGMTDIGGSITTTGSNIGFSGPITLTGDLSLNSGNGSITLGSDLEGPFSVTITAGTGDVIVPTAFSTSIPLQNFTVASAYDIQLNGIGSLTSIMSGAL